MEGLVGQGIGCSIFVRCLVVVVFVIGEVMICVVGIVYVG